MHRRVTRYILALFIFIAGFAIDCKAQFKEEAFQQTYNEEGTYDNYNFPLEDQPFDESDANQNLIVKK